MQRWKYSNVHERCYCSLSILCHGPDVLSMVVVHSGFYHHLYRREFLKRWNLQTHPSRESLDAQVVKQGFLVLTSTVHHMVNVWNTLRVCSQTGIVPVGECRRDRTVRERSRQELGRVLYECSRESLSTLNGHVVPRRHCAQELVRHHPSILSNLSSRLCSKPFNTCYLCSRVVRDFATAWRIVTPGNHWIT